MRLTALSLLAAGLAVASCAATEEGYKAYLRGKGITHTAPDRFQHCKAYGCAEVTTLELSAQDWKKIEALFKPPPQNAAEERARIGRAIGLLETIIGPLTGTENDKYGTFRNLDRGQLDCIDESTNTTLYLALLKQKKYLKFHEIRPPTTRFPVIHAGRWPHQTAVIEAHETNALFAVDSWFHDNGYPAEIVPLSDWKNGWRPETHKQNEDISDKE